ncbi:MAG: sodium transporter, partial [Cytophagales bacterium]|nr:sodium transporter [Cytophagales bacterium]
EQVMQNLPPDFYGLLNGEYTVGFILAFLTYHICYIGGNWTFVQRYTSVDSPKSARKVAFLFAGLYLVSPVIWMLPPMIYRTLNPGLQGLDTENAYLLMCKLVLPPGLLGLMLTGMYFSTSASANTTLNVVSAVFTNDIYKGLLRPKATDRQLITVARLSSWGFGIGMIVIALLVPYVGGIVEVVLSVAAVTGGPLLAPPLWALFSKRLTGKVTFRITVFTLSVNLFFKVLAPLLLDFKLSRAQENILGVGLPLLLLLAYELWASSKNSIPEDYQTYLAYKDRHVLETLQEDESEKLAIEKQNLFGLRVIAFALVFTAVILFVLSGLTDVGKIPTALVAALILCSALVPWRAAAKNAHRLKAEKRNAVT